jgi:hypothetical protein
MTSQGTVALTITPLDMEQSDPRWAATCNILRQQLQTLNELDVSVPEPSQVPKDAKGDPITIGAFILTLAAAPAMVKLVEVLNTWVSNLGKRKVDMTISIRDKEFTAKAEGYSKAEVQSMMEIVAKQINK